MPNPQNLKPDSRKGRRFDPFPLSQTQVEQLLANLKPLPRTALALSYSAGLRVSEICKLRRADLDLEGCALRVVNSKYGKTRVVPFGDAAKKHLEAWIAASDPQDLMFPTKPILLNKALQYAWKVKLGNKGRISWHNLRHGAAVRLASANVPTVFVSKFLGHSRISVTDSYLARIANTETIGFTRAHTY